MSRRVYSRILDDRFIERSLTDKAGEIEPLPGMASRVGYVLRTGVAHKKPPLAWIPSRKRIASAAACLVLAGSVVFMTSPALQAWAATQAEQLINHVQVMISTKNINGHQEVSVIAGGGQAKAPANGHPVSYRTTAHLETLAQAEKTVGFHIKLPSYLPADCQVPPMVSVVSIMKTEGQGQSEKLLATGKEVGIWFDRGQNKLPGLELDISQISMPHPGQVQYTSIQVNGRQTKWFDNELAVNNTTTGRQQVVTEHILSWTEGGLQYTLTDHRDLLMSEMVKIAESLK